MNGNISCFTGWHIPLALLAIAVLVLTILLIPVVGLISLKRRLIKVHKKKKETSLDLVLLQVLIVFQHKLKQKLLANMLFRFKVWQEPHSAIP